MPLILKLQRQKRVNAPLSEKDCIHAFLKYRDLTRFKIGDRDKNKHYFEFTDKKDN